MNWHEAALILLVVCVFIPLAAVLIRTRDRLASRFGQDGIVLHGMRHIGDGIKVCVMDVEGQRILCAYGRSGQPALHVLGVSPPSVQPVAKSALSADSHGVVAGGAG
jgi:hypothetical protein